VSWLESHQSLREHPKKNHLAELLYEGSVPDDVADVAAIGLLFKLWWWALDYAPKGDLSGFTDRQIAKGCQWAGSPQVLVESLKKARWIDRETNALHDWEDYGGRLVAKREADAERKRSVRGASAGRDADAPRDGAGTDSTVHTEQTKPLRAPVARSIVDKSSEPTDGGFSDFWQTYPRRERKSGALRRWRHMSMIDRQAATTAAPHYADYARRVPDAPLMLATTFLSAGQRSWEDWIAGIPPDRLRGNNGKQAAAVDKPVCPNDGAFLTFIEGRTRCPVCDWMRTP
jgi:hypothetical protein